MKNTGPFYIVFQVLKVLLIKICKIQPSDLLFLTCTKNTKIIKHQADCWLVYDQLKNNLPETFSNFFTLNTQLHKHNT